MSNCDVDFGFLEDDDWCIPEVRDDDFRQLDPFGFPGHAVSSDGVVWNYKKDRILRQRTTCYGYKCVSICNRSIGVHRLVAFAWVHNPKPDEYDVVNHLDCNRTNNRADNLEWCTQRQNVEYQYKVGSLANLLTEEQVHLICREFERGLGCTEIANKHGFSYASLYQIKRGINWTRITDQYNFRRPVKYRPKLTEEDVLFICKRYFEDYMSVPEIVRKFGYDNAVVSKIVTGKNWRKITDDFIFEHGTEYQYLRK